MKKLLKWSAILGLTAAVGIACFLTWLGHESAMIAEDLAASEAAPKSPSKVMDAFDEIETDMAMEHVQAVLVRHSATAKSDAVATRLLRFLDQQSFIAEFHDGTLRLVADHRGIGSVEAGLSLSPIMQTDSAECLNRLMRVRDEIAQRYGLPGKEFLHGQRPLVAWPKGDEVVHLSLQPSPTCRIALGKMRNTDGLDCQSNCHEKSRRP